jgi:hypothetical protein
MAETGLGSETVRAPRLPLVGAEREEILGIIRRAISVGSDQLSAIGVQPERLLRADR